MTPESTLIESPQSALVDHTFERHPLGLAACTPDGKFTRVNPRIAAMLGYSSPELTCVPWIAVTHPADRQGDAAAMAELRAGHAATIEREKRFLRRDGDVTAARVRVVPLGDPKTDPCLAIIQPTPQSSAGLWSSDRYRR